MSPLSLIPVCWFLELTASVLIVRSSFRDADHSITFGLLVGTVIGLPLGLLLTTTIPVESSKLVALILIAVLAALQISRVKLPFLATRPGLYGSGIMAGIATGVASIGGMIVALYVLASDAKPRTIRASLVSFLFLSSFISPFLFIWFDVFTEVAFTRSFVLILPTLLGVALGKLLFRPALEPYYKPFCLSLLAALALLGLARTAF